MNPVVYTIFMGFKANITAFAQSAILPVCCLVMMSYFILHALTGPTSVMAWRQYMRDHAAINAQADQFKAVKLALAHQVELLNPQHVDSDLADELVRRNLGVVKKGELIVAMPDTSLPESK
jgi:cell division protein FtsB